jgi:predicted AlkP superfamily phosphohydrolase/phosphomutase
MGRVFILGWDGATFDLIRPWAASGRLPVIGRLMAEGSVGPLQSTQPPMTFPAWSSFMTGKNPGQHGIYDFTRQRPGSYDLEFVNGGQRRGATFWQLLSEAGRDVISISLPCTFPPERVRGVMISGFDAPGGGPGSYVDQKGMYPPELYEELARTVGLHPIGASIIKQINQGKPQEALEEVSATIRKKGATAKYLLQHKPWDCFMILFGESDMLAHQLWKFSDPQSPLRTGEEEGLQESLLAVYQELDRQAGELLELLPSGVTVLVMSDHGFGGVSDWALYPNCWLREKGFLGFRGGRRNALSRWLDTMKIWGLSHFPAGLRKLAHRLGGRRLGQLEGAVRFGTIDWAATEAYFDENPYYPFLWVNLRGRQPKGVVERGAHYERVRDRLIEELRAWRHPDSNEPVVEKAWRREEIYSGPATSDAPDVIVKWGLHRGYSYAFKLSAKSRQLSWTERLDPRRKDHSQFFTNKSGSHRDLGILIASGAGIRPGVAVEGARIIDIAPTVLTLLGVTPPSDMDGRVIKEILTETIAGTCAARDGGPPPRAASPEAAPLDSSGYSAEEEEKIAERLKALGYVE